MVNNQFYIRAITSFIMIIIFTYLFFYYDYIFQHIISFIYLVILFEIFLYFKKNLYFIYLLIYICISYILFQSYLYFYYEGLSFLLFVLTIIIFDIFSYIFGYFFGYKKMIPRISPNKTYFGFVCGFISGLIFCFIYNYFHEIMNIVSLFFLSSSLLIFAFLGDVIESLYKRKSNIKNSSNFIPGHGGFFDRFDSFISAIYIMFFFNHFIL